MVETAEKPNWAGFRELEALEKAAPEWAVVDTETTELTPFSVPKNISKKNTADPTPRLRVVTVLWPAQPYPGADQRVEAWDLDALPAATRKRLLRAVLGRPLVVGHNVSFDLYWLRYAFGPGAPMPREVADTMLMARLARPDIPIRLRAGAADRGMPPELVLAAEKLVKDRKYWALDSLALVLFREILPKDLQKPENWRGELTGKHYQYAISDVILTAKIFHTLTGSDWQGWKARWPEWAGLLAGQTEDVVRIRENGFPWSAGEAEKYAEKYLRAAAEAAEEVIRLAPELAPFREALADPDTGESDAYKQAFARALERFGVLLPKTRTGKVSTAQDALKLAGATDHPEAGPFVAALERIKRAEKRVKMAREYTGFAMRSPDGRIHAMISHGAVTGRLTSQDPNVQNMPRDPDFRAIVRVPEGWKIVAADYGQIELRIAAALAIRAQREARQQPPDWLKKAPLVRPAHLDQVRERLAALRGKPNKSSDDWEAIHNLETKGMKAEACLLWEQFGGRECSPLRDIFAAGGDPHLYTALGLLGRGPAAALDPAQAKEMKADPEIKEARQRAKALNFGLLYGMRPRTLREYAKTEYNVEMTLGEAEKSHSAWLRFFPEIRFWQLWTMLEKVVDRRWVATPGKDRKGGVKLETAPIFRVSTLAGRVFMVANPRDALNYQDQGTGADILMRAVRYLREAGQLQFVANLVHDEIVMAVPAAAAEEAAQTLTAAMLRAGEEILSPWGVPTTADVARLEDGSFPDFWLKD